MSIKDTDQRIADLESSINASSSNHWKMPPTDAEHEAESIRAVDTVDMVKQVTSRIEAIQTRLNATAGFDAKTGEKRHVVNDHVRGSLEVELYHLKNSVLPYTQTLAEHIKFKQSQLETPEQRLQAEADRQQRLNIAAEKRAEELEIEEKARRIIAQRNRGS